MKYIFALTLTLTLALMLTPALSAYAQHNAGLVDGIWFSTDPVSNAGETRVYTAVYNSGSETLTGLATLFVNGSAVGVREVRVARNDIARVAFSYAFSAGTADVRITLTPSGSIAVAVTELARASVLVVADTDGDGIQDTTDPDDDNDGIPDEQDPDPYVAAHTDATAASDTTLSERGRALLAQVTRERGERAEVEHAQEPSEAQAEAHTQTRMPDSLATLERTRTRAAQAVHEYGEEHEHALAALAEREEALAAVEGFEPTAQQESKKREHQIAAAAAAFTGGVLSRWWLFYPLLALSLVALVYLTWRAIFRRRKQDEAFEEE